MIEAFKNVIIMSILGFCFISLLLILKPITSEKFSAKWQYCAWIAVMVVMLVPFWRFIPQSSASEIIHTKKQVSDTVPAPDNASPANEPAHETAQMTEINGIPIEYREVRVRDRSIKIIDLLGGIWLGGACVFLVIVTSSYAVYVFKKRKSSVAVETNGTFERAKSELKIKRRIRIRMSPDIRSPLLCGVLFPVVYIPCADISEDKLRMVFLHELTHYKRGDLFVKWLAVFVNAVHWFNPLAYMLTVNVGEACEVSCDMEVTKNMTEDEQRLYMQTVLEMI